MRIVIENGIEGYNSVYLDVADWFAEQEELRKSASFVRETEKAILLDFSGKQKWIPKSLYTVNQITKGLEAW